MEHTKNVDTAGFTTDVVERSRETPVVVDFWAEWCGPCRVLGPTLERLADEHQGAFDLAKLDVDVNPDLARQFQVQGIPTVIAFKDGVPVARFTGALPESQIRTWLREFVPSEADEKAAVASTIAASGDLATAEGLFREALAVDPVHEKAATGLAEVLIAGGRTDEALVVLAPLPTTPAVQRLAAAARMAHVDTSTIDDLQQKLSDDPDNGVLLLQLGKALSAADRTEEGLQHLLHAVGLGGDIREEARVAILDIFELLGPDDPLTGQYRRKLVSALF
ncbi:MAG: thioredoxin [Acidimicrobiia bacterium]